MDVNWGDIRVVNTPSDVLTLSGDEKIPLIQENLRLQSKTVTGLFASLSPATIAAMMTAWLNSLPTSPGPTPDWWNNGGIPTYS